MAKYKISLLTAISNNTVSEFIPTEIGEYNNQIIYDSNNTSALTAHKNNEQSFCYTYNEKYSQHQNAQKELTFSMDRNILLHDEWMHNPYVAAIHVGSLIQLQDKYDNTILFIVKQISYAFKEHNITYNYTCQDAFSYQYTRQQSGYTIENDASSETFIGPKTVDWWVIKKIVPECYIKYEYIPLQVGLYEENGKIYRFTNDERLVWDKKVSKNGKQSLRKIIKEPFTNEEYQTTLTFACSGTNANAALISLGENLELMIHTLEKPHNDDYGYYQFFWYEPKQNQDITGLTYSPKSQISKFDLNFAGDSLTTVLNVNSHNIGDDLITLIPSTPSIFTNLFMTKDWEKPFYPGYFSDIINGQNYKYSSFNSETNYNTLSIQTVGVVKTIKDELTQNTYQFVCINIGDVDNHNQPIRFTLPLLYNRFSDNWEHNKFTEFTYAIDEQESYNFRGTHNHTYLIIQDDSQGEANTKNYIIHEDDEIPQHLLGKTLPVLLGIRVNSLKENAHVNITNLQIYINLYRLFTEEEKSFATVADQCPWLENRLIDFSYFLQQGIISRQEYEIIMSKLQNDLRIVNGKLLFLTDSYYRALKTKTQILADLTNKLDALGAAFNADVVTPLLEGKEPTDLSSFISAYATVFNIDQGATQILNYNEILNDYFDKYLTAEQRFLKNIYAFRRYFNEPCTFSYNPDAGVYQDKLEITFKNDTNFIAFGSPHFASVLNTSEANIKNYQWFYNQNGKYIVPTIVSDQNKTLFYKPLINAESFVPVDRDVLYDYQKNNTYWISKEEYKLNFDTISRSIDKINTYVDDNGTTYYELTTTELKRLIINEHPKDYYLRNSNTYTAFNLVRQDYKTIADIISWSTLPNLLKYWDITADYDKKYTDICDWRDDGDSSNGKSFFWDYYKAFFPINSLYYFGPVINVSSKIVSGKDENNKQYDYTEWKLQRINENGKPDKDTTYKEYQIMPFAGNGALLKNWGPCSNDDAVLAKTNIANAWNYAAFNYAPSSSDFVGPIALGAACGAIGFFTNPVVGIVITLGGIAVSTALFANLDEGWCSWKNNTNAFRSFEGSGDTRHARNNKHGHETMPQELSKGYYGFDSYYANYATSTEAAAQHIKLSQLWYNLKAKGVDSGEPADCGAPNTTWQKINYTGDVRYDLEGFNKTATYNFYEYFNFYKYIVPSYSFRFGVNNNLYVKNKYFRILSKDSLLNKRDTYIRIPVYSNSQEIEPYDINKNYTIDTQGNGNQKNQLPEHTRLIYIKNPKAFTNRLLHSALTWYPLYDAATDIETNALTDIWKDKNNITLQELLNSYKDENTHINFLDEYLVCVSSDSLPINPEDAKPGIRSDYFYAHVEDYSRQVFDDSNQDKYAVYNGSSTDTLISELVSAVGPNAIKNLTTIYSIADDSKVNPLKIPGILNLHNVHLYVISSQDTDMIPLTDDSIETTKMYEKITNYSDDNKETAIYERVYSKEQILAAKTEDTEYCSHETANNFKYIDKTSQTFVNFTKNTKTFQPNLYLCKLEEVNGIYSIKSTIYQGDHTLNFSNDNLLPVTLYDENGESYKSTIVLIPDENPESLIGISNGTFWYRYYSRIEIPTLFEYAASIETQLQTYWDQAYAASKYCKYFLPQYWQPQNGNLKNAFASDIIIPSVHAITKEKDGELIVVGEQVVGVTLSNMYLPEVEIYTNDAYETFKYKHYLTKYIWRYRPTFTVSWNDLSYNAQVVSAQDNDNYINAATVPVLNNNKAVLDLMSHLGTKLQDWDVVENGYTVYYYQSGENTGMLWSDLIREKLQQSNFEHLDGLYGMMFYLLKNTYTERTIQEYESMKLRKQAIWNQIYSDYPFLMLEDNYTYELATTSEELLKMAQLVFKGKKQPEKGYSVSMIDLHSLMGYQGQELKPGQGILLNASEYYDEYDDIYSALSQYLFITDVSYSLRSDADINITVNSIKYQEKLLQSLVKLIR